MEVVKFADAQGREEYFRKMLATDRRLWKRAVGILFTGAALVVVGSCIPGSVGLLVMAIGWGMAASGIVMRLAAIFGTNYTALKKAGVTEIFKRPHKRKSGAAIGLPAFNA